MMLARSDANALKPWTRAEVMVVAPLLRRVLAEAASWDDVLLRLQASGHALAARGQGLIIFDTGRSGYVKMSSLGAGFRLLALERRFGEAFREFQARTVEPHRDPEREQTPQI